MKFFILWLIVVACIWLLFRGTREPTKPLPKPHLRRHDHRDEHDEAGV